MTGIVNAEELLKNGDFSAGAAHWRGDGVFKDGAYEVRLHNSKWATMEQKFDVPKGTKSIDLVLEVKVSSDFAPKEESKDYDPVKFAVGGQYVWSARVYPKCELLIHAQHEGWLYRLYNLKRGDEWQTIKTKFIDYNKQMKDRIFAINVPPGEGTLYIKSVKLIPVQ